MPERSPLPDIPINDDCNYIAAFLTMACPYHCSYCINEFASSRKHPPIMPAEDWISALSRLQNLQRSHGVVPVTFQGGEPSVHPGFYDIINSLDRQIRIDILTNLSFDVDEMIALVDPQRLRRDAPYASIRVSYHPDQVQLDELLAKTHKLQDAGFSIGLFGVLHPDQFDIIMSAQQRATDEGIDFRTKDFLGYANGKMYGRYKYPQSCTSQTTKQVMCRTTELLMGSDGSVYRCHHDLYEQLSPIGHILDPDFRMTKDHRLCDDFGRCNPCDVKLKTNRLQQFGYTAVDIKFLKESQTTEQEHLQTSNV